MYTAQTLVDKIKFKTKEKNILIRDMLKACDLSVNAINTISDKKGLSSFSLAKIADFLDCSVDYLLGRTETSKIINMPDEIVDYIMGQYKEITENFISDAFIKAPTKLSKGQDYCFADKYYNDYINIYDKAYEYANMNNMDITEFTGVKSKKEYMEMITFHNDIFSRTSLVDKFYTLNGQTAYNKFHEVYKLYVKAYTQQILENKKTN